MNWSKLPAMLQCLPIYTDIYRLYYLYTYIEYSKPKFAESSTLPVAMVSKSRFPINSTRDQLKVLLFMKDDYLIIAVYFIFNW